MISASSTQSTSTGAHRSPYRTGWTGSRSSEIRSDVAPSSTKARPVAALISAIAARTSCPPASGTSSWLMTKCTGRHGSKVIGDPSGRVPM